MNTNVQTFVAEGTIERNRFVRPGSGERGVTRANAATNKLLGVHAYPKTASAGEQIGITMEGVVEVVAGGSVSYGDYLTSDNAGRAVATTTAGQVVRGIALQGGAENDIIKMLMVYLHHKA